MSRVMIVAGEASGDLHGANLVLAARELDSGLEFFGTGGERLRKAGTELMYGIESMSLMGGTEVVSGIKRTWDMYRDLKGALTDQAPSALVLIDYPELNLPLAKAARQAAVPVFYYVCPQIWAWRTWRIRKMERYVDRRVVVFPFEVDFYNKNGLSADFVGHPLLDVMARPRPKEEAKTELGLDPKRTWLLLMPGSRQHLVKQLLPIMLESTAILRRSHPNLGVVLAQADTVTAELLAPMIEAGGQEVSVIAGKSHLLQNAADLAVVASGTSNLETALMSTPMVVVYRTGFLTAFMGLLLVKTEHVSIVNLIADHRLVPELLQYYAKPERIAQELDRILSAPGVYEEMQSGLREVGRKLGSPGASRRAAELLMTTIGRRP